MRVGHNLRAVSVVRERDGVRDKYLQFYYENGKQSGFVIHLVVINTSNVLLGHTCLLQSKRVKKITKPTYR